MREFLLTYRDGGSISVVDMYRRGWGVREAGRRWRRRLFVWEDELHMECCAILDFIFLQEAIPDRLLSQQSLSFASSHRPVSGGCP
jgi:hypothetical protein